MENRKYFKNKALDISGIWKEVLYDRSQKRIIFGKRILGI